MSPIIERTYPNGTTAYGIRYTDEHGVERKQFSRTWTKSQARAELAKVEEKLDAGVPTRVDMTVADLFHDWHRNHAMLACTPVWQQDSTTQFNLRIEPIIGHRKIDTVTRQVITQMMRQIQAVLREKDPTVWVPAIWSKTNVVLTRSVSRLGPNSGGSRDGCE